MNIAAALAEKARLQPDRTAITFLKTGASLTFRQLDEDCDRVARGLEAAGVRRGTRTAVMVRPGPDFFAVAFALFKLGAVPVLIDPGLGRKGLGRCLDEAAPAAFIGIPAAHAGRVLFGWGKRTLKTLIVVGPRRLPGVRTLEYIRNLGAKGGDPLAATRPEDIAAILFTSGSTGSPKGAVYTHGNFAAQVELLRSHLRIEPGEVDLPTFPLFALFGPALGMTSLIPDMDFTRPGSVTPKNIIGPIQEHRVTHLFGSPALLSRVGRWAAGHEEKLPSLKRVVSAGAPVSPKVLEGFQRLLSPGIEIHTPYGATEALPVACIGSREILEETRLDTAAGKGICVGLPLPGVEVSILGLSDGKPLPTGEVGEILVRGAQVTESYFGRPDATALAKVSFPDGTVGHRMGDLGYLDPKGRLWFCGRKAHRVVTTRGTLYTIQCEGVFNQHPSVNRSALVGLGEAPVQTPVLVVELEKGVKPTQELRGELIDLGARFAHTKCIADVLFHPSFPVDIRHNAKIFREKLAVWAKGRVR